MQLFKSPEIIEQLAGFDEYFKTAEVECWSSQSGKITLYCFSSFYETGADLEKGYKELRDHIAISFQSRTLQKAAERWNLYMLFLVKGVVSQEIKQRIVHDKFSARKIVHSTGNQTVDDAYIKQLISSSLLDIRIEAKVPSTGSLDEVLKASHPKTAAALAEVPFMNNRDQLLNLLNLLNDE